MTPDETKIIIADVLEKVGVVHGTTLRNAVAVAKSFDEFRGEFREWRASVDETLRGDGNGHPGLTIMMDRMKSSVDAMWKKYDSLFFDFNLAVNGHGGKPGIWTLLDRINERERNRSRWSWTFRGAIVTLVVADIYLKFVGQRG